MKIRLFYHSLVSDWNHGNAHFLRGIASELTARGHDVLVYAPEKGWSVTNLVEEHGQKPLRKFQANYPMLRSVSYNLAEIDLHQELAGADLVIVHEWSDFELVRRIGECRAAEGFVLLFHDTHHRLVTDRSRILGFNLSCYDGVLAYGKVLSDLYVSEGLARRAWTWHEAADTRIFQPLEAQAIQGDAVWIGNWGDDERTEELKEFLIQPIKALGLKAQVNGVRYPDEALAALAEAGILYAGWLPNFDVPKVFAQFKFTVHIPRRPYAEALPGIPTIRPFEALACGIPLVSAPWQDVEGLFTPGKDFLVARNGREMQEQMQNLRHDSELRNQLAEHGLATVRRRHTCAHRVDELLNIVADLRRTPPTDSISIRPGQPCSS